jgi:hypothetical protein
MATASLNPVNLQPLSLSELLDRTFTIYRRNFWYLCGALVLPQVIVLGFRLVVLIVAPVTPALLAPNPQNPFAVFAAMRGTLISGLLVGSVVVICQGFALGAISIGVSEICLGRAPSVKASYAAVFRRAFPYLGLLILLALIGGAFLIIGFIGGGFLGGVLMAGAGILGSTPVVKAILAVIATILVFICLAGGALFGLWLWMRFAVSVPVFLLEHTGAVDALPRSGELTAGNRGRILVAIVVMWLVAFVVQFLLAAPFAIFLMISALKGLIPLWAQLGSALADALGAILAGSLMMITLTLIYYDVRIRKEAFDLETMLASSAPATPAASAPPPEFQ